MQTNKHNSDKKRNSYIFFYRSFTIISIIMLLLFLYHGFNGFSPSLIWNSLYHSDFYINYEGGFMRRGLDGEIIYQLSRAFHFKPETVQKIYSLIFLLAFIFLIVQFIKKNKPPYYVIFSMAVLLIYTYYLANGIRKDHILLVLFFFNLWIVQKCKIFRISIILQNIVLIIGTLIHEVFFLIAIIPGILANYFVYFPKGKIKHLVAVAFSFIPSALVFLTSALILPGTPEQKVQILNSWENLKIPHEINFNLGIFEKPLYIWDNGLTTNHYIFFGVMRALFFLFIWIGISNHLKTSKQQSLFFFILVLQYLVSAILSIVAIDHSRWIFFANFTAIITIYFLINQNVDFKYDLPTQFQKILKKLYFLPFLLYFVISVPHSGGRGIDHYIKSHPFNLISKMFTGDYLFRVK